MKNQNSQSWKDNLASNRELKKEIRTLSGVRKILLSFNDDKEQEFRLDSFSRVFLRATKKDVEKWRQLQETCNPSKSGNYSVHAVKIALRKIERMPA